MAKGQVRGPKLSPHVPITMLSWVLEKKVKIFIMRLLWPHLKNLCWAMKNAKFCIFGTWQKLKNGQNLATFGQKVSRFCTPAESSQNGSLSFSNQTNSFTNQTAGGHFVFCPKTHFLTLGAPCAAPNQIFPQKWSQKLHWTYLGKVKPYYHSLWIKKIAKILFEKWQAESAPTLDY